jgi:hypothetical protein
MQRQITMVALEVGESAAEEVVKEDKMIQGKLK